MRRLDALRIDYDVCPGVPAYAAAAAALKRELTLPDVGQTVILTRTATRSSKMPNGEDLPTLARSGATLAIHLGIANLANVVRDLTPLRRRLSGRRRLPSGLAGREVHRGDPRRYPGSRQESRAYKDGADLGGTGAWPRGFHGLGSSTTRSTTMC